MDIGGPFSGNKARPGHDADHSSPSSAEVKNEQELYLLSPLETAWHRGTALLFYFTSNILYKSTVFFKNTFPMCNTSEAYVTLLTL
jgi:hypothetical protein